MALSSRLTDATQADLERLVEVGASEGQHQDFKRDFPSRWDNETKARVVADVIAFANAGGGDVIYGVDEDEEGRARSIVPQLIAKLDEEVRRLMDIALNQTEPRVPGVMIHPIPVTIGAMSGHVIVMRVPQSWLAPHRSRINLQFHVREGLRNRTLDIPDIRAMFLRGENQSQRLRDFRSERLSRVITGQTPVALEGNPKLVVHAIATQAASGQVLLDPVTYSRGNRQLPYIGTIPASSVSINLDGAFAPVASYSGSTGYTQQFRQGYFEAVWELISYGTPTRYRLPGVTYEQYINSFLNAVRKELYECGISIEIAVFLSLLNARDAALAHPAGAHEVGGYLLKGFDRQDILLPEIVIPADMSIGRGMRPAYDLMCQSAGFEGSPNYGADGEWNAARQDR